MSYFTKGGPKMLLVEGDDDLHTLSALMRQHVAWDKKPETWPATVKAFGGVDKLLEDGVIENELLAAGREVVGIVVDGDDRPQTRFNAVAERIRQAEPAFDGTLQAGGTVWRSSTGMRIGVWVMPDNVSEGMLETLLAGLVVPEQKELFDLACGYVDDAKKKGASFKDRHRDKACVHAYLAARDKPGHPMGMATDKGAFGKDTELRGELLAWFVELFEPEMLPPTGD